jgi:hypothetical protein
LLIRRRVAPPLRRSPELPKLFVQVVNHAPADALGARLAPLLLRPPPPPPPPAQALANSGRAAGAVTLLIRDYRSLFLTAAAPPLAPPRPEGAAAAALRPEGPRGSPGRAPIAGLAALMAGRLSAQLALRDSGGGSPRASECPVGAPRSAGPCDEGAWDEGACSGGQLARGPAPLATATDAGGTGAGGRGAGELTPRSRTRAEADEIWAAAAAAEAARSAGACGGCGGAGVTADPEADPDAAEAEAEIDSLLSGSLEAVLFEPDDAAFRAAINPNPNPARSATCSAEPGPGSPDSSAGSGSSWSGALCASFPPGASLLVSPRGVAPGSLEPAKGAAAAAAALCGLPSPPPSLTLRQGITAAMLVCGGVSGAPSADMAAAAAAAAAAQPAAWGLGSASPKRRLSDEAKVSPAAAHQLRGACIVERGAACLERRSMPVLHSCTPRDCAGPGLMNASGGHTVLCPGCAQSGGENRASHASASHRGAAQALLGEKQTVALARALADADACNAWCARGLSGRYRCRACQACASLRCA